MPDIIEIKSDRLERFFSNDVHLRDGSGDGVNGTFDACVMQAVDWLTGGDGTTDSPSWRRSGHSAFLHSP